MRLVRPRAALLLLLIILPGCEMLRSLSPESPPAARPEAPPPPPPRPGEAARPPEIKLVGLSLTETEALLGPPALSTERPPAKVWEYRSGDCSLDVYFYLDIARNDFYALHYDTPPPTSSSSPLLSGASSSAADRCLRRVYNARRQH